MSITAERRTALISDYATQAADTGSPEVQVALLSERITNLTEHLKTHARRQARQMTLGLFHKEQARQRQQTCQREHGTSQHLGAGVF